MPASKLLFFISVFLVAMLSACHPAKRMAKADAELQALKNKWNIAYLQEHPCPQLPALNLDSICEQLGYRYPVSVTGNGSAQYVMPTDTAAAKPPCKPRNILVPGPVDTRLATLLSDSLESVRRQLAYCEGKTVGVKEVYRQQSKWKWNNWSWLFLALALLEALRIFIKYRYKIAWL